MPLEAVYLSYDDPDCAAKLTNSLELLMSSMANVVFTIHEKPERLNEWEASGKKWDLFMEFGEANVELVQTDYKKAMSKFALFLRDEMEYWLGVKQRP